MLFSAHKTKLLYYHGADLASGKIDSGQGRILFSIVSYIIVFLVIKLLILYFKFVFLFFINFFNYLNICSNV